MNNYFVKVPHPRVIAAGFNAEELEALRPICGNLVRMHKGWHPEEHDVLLEADRDELSMNPVPFRIQFMSRPAKQAGSGSSYMPFTRAHTQFDPARNLEIDDFAKAEKLETLIKDSCAPEPGVPYRGFSAPVRPEFTALPLLREDLRRPLVLAAILENNRRPESPGKGYESTLWLPSSARSRAGDWLRYAISRWRAYRPDLFPESAEWRSSDEWLAPEELRTRAILFSFDEEAARRVAQAAEQRAALVDQVRVAEAEGGEQRRILEATGDDLVAVLINVFFGLGFEVVDADQLPQHKGKKQEDLRLVDGSWTAIAEVKGYTGAAKSNDLMRVQRAVAVYAAVEGKLPEAVWYIVNAHLGMDPSQRPEPLAAQPDVVAEFAENSDGTVLDTRELFKLWRAVQMDEITAESARLLLKGSRGYFRYIQQA